MNHWQAEHERIGIDGITGKALQTCNRDRNHQQREQQHVGRKQPARQPQVGGPLIFDERDLELARQAQDRSRRQQGLSPEAGRPMLGREQVSIRRIGRDRTEQTGRPAEQPEQGPQTYGSEGQQFDQRLEGHRQHHAAVVLAGLQSAHPEQDRERTQCQCQKQRQPGIAESGRTVDDDHQASGHRL